MSTELTTQNDSQRKEIVPGFFNLQSFELLQRICNGLMSASIIPDEYKKNFGNCMIAVNVAMRMNIDPLTVMQNLYIVYGKPGWSSKFLIGTFNTCGKYTSIQYEFSGNPSDDSWGCTAFAFEKTTNAKLIGPTVTIDIAKKEKWYDKSGSKWKTMPEQMLRYRAAAWFINTQAPELSLGMQTEDEIRDIEGAYDGKTGEYLKPTLRNLTPVNSVDISSYEERVNNAQTPDEINKICNEGCKAMLDAKVESKEFRMFCAEKKKKLIENIVDVEELKPEKNWSKIPEHMLKIDVEGDLIEKEKEKPKDKLEETLEKIAKIRKEKAEATTEKSSVVQEE